MMTMQNCGVTHMYLLLQDLEKTENEAKSKILEALGVLLSSKVELEDHFHKLGGVPIILKYLYDDDWKTAGNAFHILGVSISRRAENKIRLTTEHMFKMLLTILKQGSFKHVNGSLFLIANIVDGNVLGQTLVRDAGCLYHMVELFHDIAQLIPSHEENKSQCWSFLCTAIKTSVHNPQNCQNQHQTSLIIPKAITFLDNWFHQAFNKYFTECADALMPMLVSIITDNPTNQLSFSTYSGINTLISGLTVLENWKDPPINIENIKEKLVHLLDAAVCSNYTNCMKAASLGIVPLLLQMLLNIREQHKFHLLLTLTHLVESSTKIKEEFLQENGITTVVMATINFKADSPTTVAANRLLKFSATQDNEQKSKINERKSEINIENKDRKSLRRLDDIKLTNQIYMSSDFNYMNDEKSPTKDNANQVKQNVLVSTSKNSCQIGTGTEQEKGLSTEMGEDFYLHEDFDSIKLMSCHKNAQNQYNKPSIPVNVNLQVKKLTSENINPTTQNIMQKAYSKDCSQHTKINFVTGNKNLQAQFNKPSTRPCIVVRNQSITEANFHSSVKEMHDKSYLNSNQPNITGTKLDSSKINSFSQHSKSSTPACRPTSMKNKIMKDERTYLENCPKDMKLNCYGKNSCLEENRNSTQAYIGDKNQHLIEENIFVAPKERRKKLYLEKHTSNKKLKSSKINSRSQYNIDSKPTPQVYVMLQDENVVTRNIIPSSEKIKKKQDHTKSKKLHPCNRKSYTEYRRHSTPISEDVRDLSISEENINSSPKETTKKVSSEDYQKTMTQISCKENSSRPTHNELLTQQGVNRQKDYKTENTGENSAKEIRMKSCVNVHCDDATFKSWNRNLQPCRNKYSTQDNNKNITSELNMLCSPKDSLKYINAHNVTQNIMHNTNKHLRPPPLGIHSFQENPRSKINNHHIFYKINQPYHNDTREREQPQKTQLNVSNIPKESKSYNTHMRTACDTPKEIEHVTNNTLHCSTDNTRSNQQSVKSYLSQVIQTPINVVKHYLSGAFLKENGDENERDTFQQHFQTPLNIEKKIPQNETQCLCSQNLCNIKENRKNEAVPSHGSVILSPLIQKDEKIWPRNENNNNNQEKTSFPYLDNMLAQESINTKQKIRLKSSILTPDTKFPDVLLSSCNVSSMKSTDCKENKRNTGHPRYYHRKPRGHNMVRYSEEELKNLVAGVAKYGLDFKAIRRAYCFHRKRTSKDLYLKWRNSFVNSKIIEMSNQDDLQNGN